MFRRPLIGAVCATAFVLAGAPAAPALAADGGTLQVHVVDSSGHDAVGVHVGWYSPDQLGEPEFKAMTGVTDAHGGDALALPADAARYYVVADLPYANLPVPPDLAGTVGVFAGPTGQAPDFRNLDPWTTNAGGSLEIRLPESATVAGKVAALAHRTVQLLTLGGRVSSAVEADASGRFAFDVVPGRFRISVPGDSDHVDVTTPAFTATGGATTTVDPVQTRTGTLRGTAAVGSTPAKNMLVTITPAAANRVTHAPANFDGVVHATTDAEGRYSAPILAAGDYSVLFSRIGNLATRSSQVPKTYHLRGVPVATTTTLNAHLVKAAHIRGTFDTPKGADDFGYIVTKGSTTGPVVATGRGAAHSDTTENVLGANGLASGTYTVKASSDTGHYATKVLHVRAGATVTFGPLHPKLKSLTLTGTIPGGAGGTVDVSVDPSGTRSGTVDSHDHYRVTGLLPGTHAILVIRDGHVGEAHTLALKASRSKDYASFGPAFATATATLDLDGWPIHEGYLQYGAFDFGVSAKDGRTALVPAAARVAPGAYGSTGLYSEDENFQHASPYDVVLPSSLQHLVLHEGLNAYGRKHLTVTG